MMLKVREEWKQPNDKYKCPHCNKEFTKKGICGHIWYQHTVEGQELHQKISKPQECCLECNNLLDKHSKKFCNSSCSAKYNNRKRDETGWNHSLETKLRIKKSCSRNLSLKRNSPLKGKVLVDGKFVKDVDVGKVCPSCKETFKTSKYRPKQTCGSKKCLNRLHQEKMVTKLSERPSNFKPDEFLTDLRDRKIRFQSTFEMRYIFCLDSLLLNGFITDWKRATYSIPYFVESNRRLYLPDFEVLRNNVWELHEIKGPIRKYDRKKFESAINLGFKFKVVFGHDLKHLEALFGFKWSKDLKKYSGVTCPFSVIEVEKWFQTIQNNFYRVFVLKDLKIGYMRSVI